MSLILLMLFCLISGVFSILGARPMGPKVVNNKQGILYFNKFNKLSVDEFLNEIKLRTNSSKATYENLDIDLYYQCKTIHRKYRLLRISYTVAEPICQR